MNVGKLTNPEARVVAALRALRRARDAYVAVAVDGGDRAAASAELHARRNALRAALDEVTGFVL